MATFNEHAVRMFDSVETLGADIKAHDGPELNDDQLWAAAHRIDPLVVPKYRTIGDPDDEQLATDLRQNFAAGYWASRIKLDDVVRYLREMGHHAHIEHTGGGTATLYAGAQALDTVGDPRWSVAVGPGWFEGPGWRAGMVDTADCVVGPDDDGASSPRVVTAGMTAYDIAVWAAECIARVEASRRELNMARARVESTAQEAARAFWCVVRAAYPQVVRRKLEAEIAARLDHVHIAVVRSWLDQNFPAAVMTAWPSAENASSTPTGTSPAQAGA